jgi:hypothetical protein
VLPPKRADEVGRIGVAHALGRGPGADPLEGLEQAGRLARGNTSDAHRDLAPLEPVRVAEPVRAAGGDDEDVARLQDPALGHLDHRTSSRSKASTPSST